jgi:osmoprotectant transport system permease protein
MSGRRPHDRGGHQPGDVVDLIAAVIAWLTDPVQWQGPAGIPTRLLEHIELSAAALVVAIAVALPVGLRIGHTGRGAALAINIANLGRALPSLAVIGIVLPVTAALDPQLGFKVYPTMIAMVVLAVPPILVNAYAGISGVDRDLVESARAMGMRETQILRDIEIPIALPIIVGGIRSGAVQIVATTTLGAIFGGVGLGRYLVEGIAQNDNGKIFGGVVLVAALSLATEAVFALVQRRLTSPGLAVPPRGWTAGAQPGRPAAS